MPTIKVPATFLLRDEELDKVRYIAKYENRSFSNLMEYFCKLQIKEFERQYGEIPVENVRKCNKFT